MPRINQNGNINDLRCKRRVSNPVLYDYQKQRGEQTMKNRFLFWLWHGTPWVLWGAYTLGCMTAVMTVFGHHKLQWIPFIHSNIQFLISMVLFVVAMVNSSIACNYNYQKEKEAQN